jgi:prevent-host-death family protein
MKRMILSSDIRSISEFRSNINSFIEQIHKTRRPLVITQNGKSSAVLMDVQAYDELTERVELLQDIQTSINQISDEKAISHAAAHSMLKARYSK